MTPLYTAWTHSNVVPFTWQTSSTAWVVVALPGEGLPLDVVRVFKEADGLGMLVQRVVWIVGPWFFREAVFMTISSYKLYCNFFLYVKLTTRGHCKLKPLVVCNKMSCFV